MSYSAGKDSPWLYGIRRSIFAFTEAGQFTSGHSYPQCIILTFLSALWRQMESRWSKEANRLETLFKVISTSFVWMAGCVVPVTHTSHWPCFAPWMSQLRILLGPVSASTLYPSSSLFNGRPGLCLSIGRQSRSCFGYLMSSILLTWFNHFCLYCANLFSRLALL